MKLYAISDLHLSERINYEALSTIPAYPDDWLILGGDIGETEADLEVAITTLSKRFARLIWVPGNHDLWTLPSDATRLRGKHKYDRLVEICRGYDVLTPEDPYAVWQGDGQPTVIAPVFLLYDYSFRPEDVPLEQAIAWAAETDVMAADEVYLHSDPYPSCIAWCTARYRYTEQRLEDLSANLPIVLINHFPLRKDLAILPAIPRFSLWCGTDRTEHWHMRFPISVVVYGHLHIRGTYYRNSTRFEETSLGYPAQWNQENDVNFYLREILPGPPKQPLESSHELGK